MKIKLFTVILLLIAGAFSGQAHTSPVNPDTVLPFADGVLPFADDFALDYDKLQSDPDILQKISTATATGNTESRFYFPDLDRYIDNASAEMVLPPDPVTDDMQEVYTNAEATETDRTREGRRQIDYSKVGGTHIESLDRLPEYIGEIKLPAFYIQPLGNLEAIVILSSVRLTDSGAKLGIYIGVNIPQKGKLDPQGNQKSVTMIFGTENLTFIDGKGIQVGDIILLNDVAFELSGAKKKSVMTITGGTVVDEGAEEDVVASGTYIRFGCDGIEEFGISAKVTFSKEWLLPLDDAGEPDEEGPRVKASLNQIKVRDWNNMIFTGANLDACVLTKYRDISLELKNVNVDLSDFENPTSLKFPDNYVQDSDAPAELWRGVYIEKIEVTMPAPFKKRCDGGVGEVPSASSKDGSQIALQEELLSGEEITSLNKNMSSDWETGGMPAHGPNADYEMSLPVKADTKQTTAAEGNGCRIKVGAENLIIDKTGVTGRIYAANQITLASGSKMDKTWSWTLEEISVRLLQSELQEFKFSGDLVLPIAKKETPLAYSGGIELIDGDGDGSYVSDVDVKSYFLKVEIEEGKKMEFPLWKAADVEIYGNTIIEAIYTEEGGEKEFIGNAQLFGKMKIGKGGNDEDAKVPSIEFKNIKLSTRSPKITGGGVYLNAPNGLLAGFPVQITGIGFEFVNPADNAGGYSTIDLKFQIKLNLMKEDGNGIAASGGFRIKGKLQTNVLGADEWAFDEILLDNVGVIINLPKFKGSGSLAFFRTDPDYGKGFSAYLSACILCDEPGEEGSFKLDMAAVFGTKEGLRYFMVDGFASSSKLALPVPPIFEINGFGGGVFRHMKPTDYKAIPAAGSTAIPPGSDTSGLIYTPTPEVAFGIKFSVGFRTVGGSETFDGKLDCIIRFGPGVVLQNVMFWGVAELVNPKKEPDANESTEETDEAIKERSADLTKTDAERQASDKEKAKSKPDVIGCKVGLSFDFEEELSFHGFAEVYFNVANGKIYGSGTMDMLLDPNEDKFHIWVGGYQDGTVEVHDFFNPDNKISLYPVNVNVQFSEDISARVDTYFLLGNDIPGPPPLDPAAAAFFDISPSTNNRDGLVDGVCENNPADGTGIAFGAALKLEFKKKIKKKKRRKEKTVAEINVRGGAGFDISLLQYAANTTCALAEEHEGPEHGLNYFRATGRIYAYVDVSGKVFRFRMPSMGVGVLLEADIPDPSYFDARITLKFIKKWKFGVQLGDQCGRPCGGSDGGA